MCVIEREQPGAFGREKSESCFAQGRLDKRAALIVETHETAVERGIPVRGEQLSIEEIQSLIVAAAVRPCDDLARSQQRFITNAGKRTARAPIVEQRSTEIALA
jgi:hypothetical protein